MDVYLEVGKKRAFACSVEWPGWCRSGKGEDAALEALAAYADRYGAVLAVAGLRLPRGATNLDVVERLPGGGATDFGALDKACSADQRPLTSRDAGRLAAIVEASWQVLDDVVAGAPAVLAKGPRGGGRDRDAIADHVRDAERSYLRKVGIRDGDRGAFVDALRAARAPVPERVGGKPWPWRYAARRVTWHVLDHAWEIEDKS
jgi:hypothetical protein